MMIELAHRDLHRVPDAAGVQIRCQAGSLWITLDHDTRDIVLEAGESFSTPEHKRALVYALAPARLLIEPPAGDRPAVRLLQRRPEPFQPASPLAAGA